MAEASQKPESLAERFWSIARARELAGDDADALDPVSVVNHVLAILDEVDQGHVGDELSVNTVSFLHLLRVHEMGGDLSYASPEQIGGSELDERSLVFSIGVLIFERLTGRHPFGAAGNPRRRVARISKVEFGSGVNYFPDVPSGLRTVLMKAMGPFPEERWRSLKELRAALEYFADRSQPAVRLPGTGDDDKTQIFRPGVGSDVIEQAAESHKLGTVHEHSHASAAEERTRRLPRRTLKRWMPVMYLAIGAAAASVVFVLAGRGSGANSDETKSSAPAASATQPVVVAKPVIATKEAGQKSAIAKPAPVKAKPAPATTKPAPAKSAPAKSAPANAKRALAAKAAPAATAVATPPKAKQPVAAPTPEDEPAAFSAQRGGDRAASAVAECLAPARLAGSGVVIGLSIRFRANGSVQKLYYAADTRLDPTEVTCIRDKLAGFSAGPAKTAQVIGYRLHVSSEKRKALISGG